MLQKYIQHQVVIIEIYAYHQVTFIGQITISIFAKAAELDHLGLIDYDGSGVGIDFNLSTGVATDSATTDFEFDDMVDYGNGWYRCIDYCNKSYFYWILHAITEVNFGVLLMDRWSLYIWSPSEARLLSHKLHTYIWGIANEVGRCSVMCK